VVGKAMGMLRSTAAPSWQVVPGAVPRLSFRLETDLLMQWSGGTPVAIYHVWGHEASVEIGGVRMLDVDPGGDPSVGVGLRTDTHLTFLVSCPLHRFIVDAIDSRRTDDLSGVINFWMLVAPDAGTPERWGLNLAIKFSEKEWVKILTESGYQSSWLIYTERPEIEGWDGVQSHVTAAHERLLAKDSLGTLIECRAAIRAADPLLDGAWSGVARQIDLGSKPEEGYEDKAERVKRLREWVLKMADTGGHSEYYNPLPEDADLVYRLTCSLLAYLSKKQAFALRAKKPASK
jgi:hypothetical protein